MKLTVIALVLALMGCGNQNTQSTQITEPEPEYTLEENIGMMLLVGFRGTELDYNKNIEIISIYEYFAFSRFVFSKKHSEKCTFTCTRRSY